MSQENEDKVSQENETKTIKRTPEEESFFRLLKYVNTNGMTKSQFESLFKDEVRISKREALLAGYIQFLEAKVRSLEVSLEDLAVFGSAEISRAAQRVLEKEAPARKLTDE